MQDPLKQGLKHLAGFPPDPRGHADSNARSTKTRIETTQNPPLNIRNRHIRMQDPLKQGLKQLRFIWRRSFFTNSNARSTKTRIETYILENVGMDELVFECKIH